MNQMGHISICYEGEIEQIADVDQALDFLQRWPSERRGRVYRSSLNACGAAIAAQLSTNDAMKAFTEFARATNILLEDDDRQTH